MRRLVIAGLAVAAGVGIYVAVELLGAVEQGGAEIGERLSTPPPGVLGVVTELEHIEQRVAALPTDVPTPTVIVTAPAVPGPQGPIGPPGPTGAPGRAGGTRVVTVTGRPVPSAAKPRPAPTVTVTAEPVCLMRAGSLCISRP